MQTTSNERLAGFLNMAQPTDRVKHESRSWYESSRKFPVISTTMKIFLSYSSIDRDLADQIRLTLVAQKHSVFLDRHDLAPGLEYDARIAQAIENADLFIFLISPESIAAGRYTLTELSIAQRTWSHPDPHVLPVMIRVTPIEHIPPYLKAVTILKPAGNIPADVAAEVRRRKGRFPGRLRWVLGGAAVAAVAGLVFGLSGLGMHAQQAAQLLQAARSLEAAGDHASAWSEIQEARAHVAESPFGSVLQHSLAQQIADQQINIAVAWLDNMRLQEDQRFSTLTSGLLPTLDEAISTAEGERKADLLAHRGWADFLRSRDNVGTAAPESYYRRALEVDPRNVYAHAMWGHWIAWRRGKLADAQAHFNAALASGRQRPYVRGLQLASMRNMRGEETDAELLRIVHDMQSHQEPLKEDTRSDIRSIYYFACGNASRDTIAALETSLPAKAHVALLRSLFFQPNQPNPPDTPLQLCLARFEEKAGLSMDALKTYQTLHASLTARDPMWQMTRSAIARLSRAQ